MTSIAPEPIVCKIGTFNCKNLSVNDTQRILYIASTILTSKADIVAIQEISNVNSIDMLISELGHEWCGAIEKKPINTSKVKEYMGFVYRKSDIAFIGSHTFSDDDFKIYVGANGRIMKRSPVYAKFCVNSTADIVIISYHTDPKDPIHDCTLIKKNIAAIQTTNKNENIIVLGDFNTDCGNKYAFGKLSKLGYIPSLSSKTPTNYNGHEQYDNIWYHPAYCRLIEKAHVFRECIPEGATIYTYSDHLLVAGRYAILKIGTSQTFNAPDMVEAMRKKKFDLLKISCCGSTQMVCQCSTAV